MAVQDQAKSPNTKVLGSSSESAAKRQYALEINRSGTAASGRKAAIPNVGCVRMAEDGICSPKGHQRGAGERWITWDFENRSHRATRDAARARRTRKRGRPAKGTRATAASGRQGAKRLGCCSSEARKERCGHPSPDRSSRGKVAGRNRKLGEGEGSVGSSVATGARRVRMQRKLSFLKCVSPARP